MALWLGITRIGENADFVSSPAQISIIMNYAPDLPEAMQGILRVK